jgi:two-component system OmpR family response regulator
LGGSSRERDWKVFDIVGDGSKNVLRTNPQGDHRSSTGNTVRILNVADTRVLVVDDESNITDLVATALRYEGFDVEVAATGGDALRQAEVFRPDLMVLDIMLPDRDGFQVVQRLRADGRHVPVVFLTARDSTEEKVKGLTVGGDDYVTKPFSLEELVARCRAVLRRTGAMNGESSARLVFADLELDDDTHEVWRGRNRIDLTPTEYKLLRYLMLNARRALSKSQILDHVWEYDFDGDANVVETYISYLRKKIDKLGPPLIHTIRGVGYTLRTPPEN